jgi:hypothetical protein
MNMEVELLWLSSMFVIIDAFEVEILFLQNKCD